MGWNSVWNVFDSSTPATSGANAGSTGWIAAGANVSRTSWASCCSAARRRASRANVTRAPIARNITARANHASGPCDSPVVVSIGMSGPARAAASSDVARAPRRPNRTAAKMIGT